MARTMVLSTLKEDLVVRCKYRRRKKSHHGIENQGQEPEVNVWIVFLFALFFQQFAFTTHGQTLVSFIYHLIFRFVGDSPSAVCSLNAFNNFLMCHHFFLHLLLILFVFSR